MAMKQTFEPLSKLNPANVRFGEYYADYVDRVNVPRFERMVNMDPRDRIEKFMNLTPELRSQFFTFVRDLRVQRLGY